MESSANFQRDGRAVHDDNQGNRPNYPSTQQKLNLPKRAYNDANHTVWVSGIILYITDWELIRQIDWWCRQIPLDYLRH